MGGNLKLEKNNEVNIGTSQKILGSIFDKLGLKYSITKNGNFIGKGADGKSNNFIRYLQKKIGLKYGSGEKKGKPMPFDGSISENSAKIIFMSFTAKDIKEMCEDFLEIHIRVESVKKLKNHSLNTLKYFLNTSILSNKIRKTSIETEVDGATLVGTDYNSRQFINYLQVTYNLGTVDSMISNKYAVKLYKQIGNKSFAEIKQEYLEAEKENLKGLSTQIENLETLGSPYQFIGNYKKVKGEWKAKSLSEIYNPKVETITSKDENLLPKIKENGTLYYSELKAIAKTQLIKMGNDFHTKKGKKIRLNFGYRSYETQIEVKKKYGAIAANPGDSEHQTGYAIDIANTDNGLTYKWLRENAHNYGFTQSYKNKATDGGFKEAWHWRYVGKDLATYLRNHNMSFTQFYNLHK